ncbi:hypothetical protein V5799_008692 [Amblyomma americanum]|uniref:Hexosyltransferase n=1 Tax=Amblyomma americanum TaxID=6943 RepID=A0AAQ4FE58_AMBAM
MPLRGLICPHSQSACKETYHQCGRPFSRKHRKCLRHFPLIFTSLILLTAGGCILRSPPVAPSAAQGADVGRYTGLNVRPLVGVAEQEAEPGSKDHGPPAPPRPPAALLQSPKAVPELPAAAWRDDLQWLSRKIPFPLDPPNTLEPGADGHRVRQLCSTGQAEHLIFVHTDPTHAQERRLFRTTVGHSRIASLFKWTMLFLIGLRPDANVTDEAATFGDVVQLPFIDHYRNLSLKFLYGMRWVMINCPSVRSLVKIDDDVFIHPEVLDSYLRKHINLDERRLHCSVFRGNAVIRNPHSRHYLSRSDYPKKYFPVHCHGWFVVIPASVMWDLYAASFRVPFHAIDDAYVTGDLAKAASLSHVDISAVLSAEEDRLLELLRGEYMCALFTGRTKLSMRVTLWKTLSYIKKRQDLDEAMQHTLKAFK